MNRIFKYFSKENSIRGASIVLIITLSLSNVLGLLRDRYLTHNIGTYYLDIYYASFRIPDLIFNFLILGAITSAFIPVFSEFLAKGKKKEGFEVTNNLINIGLIFTIVSAILLIILMPYIVPHFVQFDRFRELETIKYSRFLMLTPIFFSVSYILGGVLNSFKRFVAYSIAPILYNLSIIFGAVFLAPTYGIKGVAIMVVAGSVLHMLVQLIPVMKLGWRYKMFVSFTNDSIKHIIKLMIPRTISMGANQIMLIVYTSIASALAAGSITAFSLANNIQTVPIVVLGTSFATAVFPTLATKIAQGKNEEFSQYLNKALKAIGFLLIPSTVVFILFRAHIVRLILGSGKFSWDDTTMTAMTLGAFSLSILAQGLVPLLSRAFYALKNTRTPMYISIVTVLISIVLAYPLSKMSINIDGVSTTLSVAGLALAFSIGNFINAFLLIYFLRQKYKGVLDRGLLFSYLKTIFISIVMGFVMWRLNHILANVFDMSRFFGILSQVVVSTFVGILVFLGLGYIFDLEEMKMAFTRKINVPTKE
jgi:putative peptidoglycan lipid II flippase